MWRATLSSLRGHKRRVLATGTAVLLGVTFLAGTLVLADTMRSGIGGLYEQANNGTDVLVRSADTVKAGELTETGSVETVLLDAVATAEGVAAVAPLIEGVGQITGADGESVGGDGPPTLAGNWVTDDGLNPYEIDEGRAPGAPHEVVIDRRSAREGDLEIDDNTVVRVPEPVEVTVVGIATLGSEDSLGPITFVAFTTEAAQDLLLAEPDQLTGVLVAAEEGVSQAQLAKRLQPLLPDGVETITGEALTAEQKEEVESDFLGFFEAFLLVFAGIALVVVTFSIYNTFSIVVAQRTRESALLRSFGASRRQVLGSVLAEATAIGLLASGLGLLAGIGLSRALTAWLEATGLDMPTSKIVVETRSIVVSLVVGLVVTLLASLAPAVKASRVLPMAALREVAVDRVAHKRWRAVAGLAVTGAGAALTLSGAAVAGDLALTGVGALVTVVGVVLFGPVIAHPVSALLGVPLGRLGVSGRLARANAMRNPMRTSGTASALMIGVAVVGAFTIVAASLKAYIDETVASTFTGELVIMSDSFGGAALPPNLAPAVEELPEVDVATGLGWAPVRLDGSDRQADTVDGARFEQVLDIGVTEGSLGDVTDGTIALSDSFAEDNGWSLGSTIPVGFADGSEQDVHVAAIYENRDIVADVLLPNETWRSHAVQSPAEDIVMVRLAEGAALEDARASVQSVVDGFAGPEVQDRQEFVNSQADEINEILAVVYVMLALAIIIAAMGIANTLSLSVHERTRELGLLRAVGQSRRQLRRMVRGEAVIVALFGTIGGLGLGGLFGWALTTALGEQEGVAVPFDLPVGQLAIVFVLGGLVGLVAALRPARRAAKLDVLDAIAAE